MSCLRAAFLWKKWAGAEGRGDSSEILQNKNDAFFGNKMEEGKVKERKTQTEAAIFISDKKIQTAFKPVEAEGQLMCEYYKRKL